MSNTKLKFITVKHENSKDNRTMCSVQGCFTIFDSPEEQESHMKEVHDPRSETSSFSCFYCGKELKHKTMEEHEEICPIKQKIDKFNKHQRPGFDGDIEYIELQEAKVRKVNLKNMRVLNNARTRTALCIYCNKRVEHAKFMVHLKMCSREHTRQSEKRLNNQEMILCPKEGCNKIIRRFGLQRHLSVKHNECKEACPKCRKRVLSTKLSVHIENCDIPSNLLKFECTYLNCDRIFSTIQGRNVHMFTHNKNLN